MPFSYSQISAFRSCPRKFEYEFIKKLKKPLTPEGCFGVSMHSTLAKFGNAEMRKCDKCENTKIQQKLFEESHPSSQQDDRTLDALIALWSTSFVSAGYSSTVAADFDRDRGKKLLAQFYAWWKKEERKVVAVEKGFKLQMNQWSNGSIDQYFDSFTRPRVMLSGARSPSAALRINFAKGGDEAKARRLAQHDTIITGRFDRVEELTNGTLRIIDFKTGGMRSQSEVDQDLQLSLYALAAHEVFGKEVSELTMLFLVDEDVVEIATIRGEGELLTAAKTISLLTERISSHDYTPMPSREKCRVCPFRRVCDASAV